MIIKNADTLIGMINEIKLNDVEVKNDMWEIA